MKKYLLLGGSFAMRGMAIRAATIALAAALVLATGYVGSDAASYRAGLVKAARYQPPTTVKLRYFGGPKSPMSPG